MNVIIVEDEHSATQNMLTILREIDPTINVLACLESVDGAVNWITDNPAPELAFFDIQLADGSAFEIFEQIEVKFPVVFTTAYNEYALKAFKVNSIDYILKPIDKGAVEFALTKYKNLRMDAVSVHESKMLETFKEMNKRLTKRSYRKALIIYKKDKLIPVAVADIAFFYIDNGTVYGMTFHNEKYVLDEKLDPLEQQLSPDNFFRVNRQYIVSRKAVKEASAYFHGRLLLKTQPIAPNEILISKARVGMFKSWLCEKAV